MLFLLATGRSFRTQNIDGVFPWLGGNPRIWGLIREDSRDTTVEIECSPTKRTVRINDSEKQRFSELLGTVQMIAILPQDIFLVEGDPARRRRFWDFSISQWDARYYGHLLKYYKCLRQRNSMLQTGDRADQERLRIWNPILEENGAYLIWKREELVRTLNQDLARIYPGMTDQKEQVRLEYKATVEGNAPEEIRSQFSQRLFESEGRDWATGFTTVGPHRDDWTFWIQDKEAKVFGSEGQKRSFVISLKLALGSFLRSVEKREPVFILDDVLTQLDGNRRRGLVKILEDYQTFFSMTSVDFHRDLVGQGKWFEVKKGTYEDFTP